MQSCDYLLHNSSTDTGSATGIDVDVPSLPLAAQAVRHDEACSGALPVLGGGVGAAVLRRGGGCDEGCVQVGLQSGVLWLGVLGRV